MDNVAIGFIGLGAGIVLVLLRVQIGVALGLVSFIGIAVLLNMRAAWGIITAIPFNFVGDWNLTAIPMFLLMGSSPRRRAFPQGSSAPCAWS
ncbi:hypothetical protein [Kaustia mangrovi]|uniref:hypothetical protein n=1 Tax=Kaustia mangrovi TaxID=2593653 RepID=UPI001FE53C92|nr:hypothetical protein [Kaustia mangrovi]